MLQRAASPAVSENTFDITQALFNNEDLHNGDTDTDRKSKGLGGVLDLGIESEGDGDGDGDEAFIAAQQSASNRKASIIKRKSVKKGGGFQAMGRVYEALILHQLLMSFRS